MDKDSSLSFVEFCICMYLINAKVTAGLSVDKVPEILLKSIQTSTPVQATTVKATPIAPTRTTNATTHRKPVSNPKTAAKPVVPKPTATSKPMFPATSGLATIAPPKSTPKSSQLPKSVAAKGIAPPTAPSRSRDSTKRSATTTTAKPHVTVKVCILNM